MTIEDFKYKLVPKRPVITHPMFLVILNKCVTVFGSMSLSVTFFCVATTAQSLPFIATEVMPSWLIDLNAYSVGRPILNIILSQFAKSNDSKWWSSRNKQPILALHGWQDNCGTLDGGRSSHYAKGMQYFLFWDGGALSFMYAASLPNDVDKFISIDIAGPRVRNTEHFINNTGLAVDKFLDYEDLALSKVPCCSYQEMVKLVVEAYDGSVDEQCVQILLERGMEMAPQLLDGSGYHFVRDVRLKVSSLAMFTADQVLAYAKKIRCKVLNIRAEPRMNFEHPQVYAEVVETLKQNATPKYLILFH
uniref:Uncharacterized protein n=1 Tax=Glossina pallidipes TaxID=7398 RepID=A0A1A9ZP74_GLOPL